MSRENAVNFPMHLINSLSCLKNILHHALKLRI